MRRPDALASRLARAAARLSRAGRSARCESLATMGVRTVGDCLRLPRDGFARRFEPQMLRRARSCARAARPIRVSPSCRGERFVGAPRPRAGDRRHRTPAAGVRAAARRAVRVPAEHGARGRRRSSCALLHRDAPPTRLRLRFAEPVAHGRRGLPAAARAARARRVARARARAAPAQRPAGARRARQAGRPLRARPRARDRGAATGRAPACPARRRRPCTACASCPSIAPRPPGRRGHSPVSRRPRQRAENVRNRRMSPVSRGRCGCSPSRSRSTAGSSRATRARSNSRKARNASSRAGGTVATCGATTTWRARRPACGCGSSASAARAGGWFLHGVFG